jgi:hypothetical protein
MRRTALLIATALLACACQQSQPERWFKGSFEQALEAAKTRDTLVLLDFSSDT